MGETILQPDTIVPRRSRRRAFKVSDAEYCRESIKRVLGEKGWTRSDLARHAGLSTPNVVNNLLNGHSESLAMKTACAINQAAPELTLAMLMGVRQELQTGEDHVIGAPVPLLGVAGAGLWIDETLKDDTKFAMPISPETRGAFCLMVEDAAGGTSDQGPYPAKSVLVVVPCEHSIPPKPGQRLVLQRRRGGLLEHTVREVRRAGRGIDLVEVNAAVVCPPVRVSWPIRELSWQANSRERMTILGVVRMACVPD